MSIRHAINTHLTRYDILYNVNQLAKAAPKPSDSRVGAVKHAVRYLAGTINIHITCKKEDFTLIVFPGKTWSNNRITTSL